MIITLDPGHGKGYNTVKYTMPDGTKLVYSEGTTNFEYALLLKERLERYGITVFMTRQTVDDFPSLWDRAVYAAEHQSDLVLSLHSNSDDHDPNKVGIVAVYSQADKDYNKPLAKKIAYADAAVMGNGVVDVFYNDYPGKPGVDYFGILRYSVQNGINHAIIIEHGYHSNREEAAWLSNEDNLKRLADVEAEAIAEYVGAMSKKGDVNCDGKVDITDVTALQNVLSGILESTPASDVNADGTISIADVTALLNLLSTYPGGKPIYRVQTGSYSSVENANSKCAKLKADGFDCFVVKVGSYYKVQLGAYAVKDNAQKLVEKLQAKGYSAIIVQDKQ